MHTSDFRYAHLHGFASGPTSRKGTFLAGRLAARGVSLALPDLNVPSFGELTYAGALAVIDRLTATDVARRWRLTGSSMGGYLAARWAELHPLRVERLVLLCPAFGLPGRLAEQQGAEALARWREAGTVSVTGPDGAPAPLHWRFLEEARRHPEQPEVPCPTLIIHGRRDETVPVESSRAYAAAHPGRVTLIEVEDDHALLGSLPLIGDAVEDFFGL